MSDIGSFGNNDLFLMGLTLFAPLGIFLLLGYLFRAAEKPRIAKVFFYLAGIYVVLVLAAPSIAIMIKG